MPNNLYGINDNFDLETSNVLPTLMRRFHDVKIKKEKSVEVGGTGNPKREFLHVDDLADACVFLMNNLSAKELYSNDISHINIGSGEEVSIKELALIIKEVVSFKGNLVFNKDYPDGTPRKLLDITRLKKMSWESIIKLKEGIKSVYDWYLKNNK